MFRKKGNFGKKVFVELFFEKEGFGEFLVGFLKFWIKCWSSNALNENDNLRL